MAMRLMLVISYLHSDACKLPKLQPSSLTSSSCQFATPTQIYIAHLEEDVSLWYDIILGEHDQYYVLTFDSRGDENIPMRLQESCS